MKTNKKIVRTLYRVSTKRQLKEEDIPVQRNACLKYLRRMENWHFDEKNSYIEKGVSGFRKSSAERDVIQTILEDAKNKEFDVLLVYMFDRLGRQQYDTPLILKTLNDLGVETWSTEEGQQKFTDHSDDLINYIRFWQADGESKKTSLRVKEAKRQKMLKGEAVPSLPPLGYKLIDSGKVNHQNRKMKKIVINESEANLIRDVFYLYHNKGYGWDRIMRTVNDMGYRNRSGNLITARTIPRILQNPIYKGHVVSGKYSIDQSGKKFIQPETEWIVDTSRKEELTIIDEKVFDEVQKTIKQRSRKNNNQSNSPRKGELLLSGIAKCGTCGGSLTYHATSRVANYKNGNQERILALFYMCYNKARSKKECDGKLTYSKKRIENAVLQDVRIFISGFQKEDLYERVTRSISKMEKKMDFDLKESKTHLKKAQKELDALHGEVSASILGESRFSPELLNDLITKKESEVDGYKEKIVSVESTTKEEKDRLLANVAVQKYIPKWEEEFQKLDKDEKKIALSKLISEIRLTEDKIEVDYKFGIEEFMQHLFNCDLGSIDEKIV
ncbi:recombinase family protein [Oceanobacillus oncorhynchi]|uniref:recombinase family protein n=1 Tax=Oceanobacillus oncorhynchi TaxID=545501 RepID=UPI0034D772BD